MNKALENRATRAPSRPFGSRYGRLLLLSAAILITGAASSLHILNFTRLSTVSGKQIPLNAAAILARCRSINLKPGPPDSFYGRVESDRFQPGTSPILLRNAKIWTGRVEGLEVIEGDLFMDRGIIKAVGKVDHSLLAAHDNLVTIDVEGAWVSPGIIDLHSHLGVVPSPQLDGAADGNSLKGLVLPFLRSIDGLNTHDEGFRLAVAGGTTTSLILVGSANAMGGQSFVIKNRPTKERSKPLATAAMETYEACLWYAYPNLIWSRAHNIIVTAKGENPARVYSGTRMDTVWAVRKAYDKARQIRDAQDEFCSNALAGDWSVKKFPEELEHEAIVDILRGKTKVQTHCYEAVDFDAFVRLSNEFKFPVAAFHHAHEAYLVPDLLKKAFGKPPAIAMFAIFSRYKREAYRHSEFAPRILADNGLKVIMKSDHPAIVSRYLLHEAQQAHYYGLQDNLALAAVTTAPAEVLGLDHRIGFITTGYDADVVVWDSHPLALGATPIQVIVDGIPQLDGSLGKKPPSHQRAPKTPDFTRETEETLKYDGLPPLEPRDKNRGTVIFRNLSSAWTRDGYGIRNAPELLDTVVVQGGNIVCGGSGATCASFSSNSAVEIDLQGGGISPSLVSGGSSIGMGEIAMEESTVDGVVPDPLDSKLLGEDNIVNAVDGLIFGTRNALLAYRSGVSYALSAPTSAGLVNGMSVFFSLGSSQKLEKGAVPQNVAAIHVSIGQMAASRSTEIAILRRLLLHPGKGDQGARFKQASQGLIPLVVTVNDADTIASLLSLKSEVQKASGKSMRMTLIGATEAHLLAKEIAAADVGVILTPPRSYPYTWSERRFLPGAPLAPQSSVGVLASHNVTVGLGPQGVALYLNSWAVRNLRFDAAWVALESNGTISKADALAMASSNIERLLGVDLDVSNGDLVVTFGGDILSFDSKVVAMISPLRGLVDIF